MPPRVSRLGLEDRPVPGSFGHDVQTNNCPGFALGYHFQRPAARRAVGVEPLVADTGIQAQFERLATIGAADVSSDFHEPTLHLRA